jgi:hypothetical protein
MTLRDFHELSNAEIGDGTNRQQNESWMSSEHQQQHQRDEHDRREDALHADTSGAKAPLTLDACSARLKPCPDTTSRSLAPLGMTIREEKVSRHPKTLTRCGFSRRVSHSGVEAMSHPVFKELVI